MADDDDGIIVPFAGKPDKRILDAGVEYCRRGWKIFPVWGIRKGGYCMCGDDKCPNPGKHPRKAKWKEEATSDEVQWRMWFDEAGGILNIGSPMGDNQMLAVDVDVGEGKYGGKVIDYYRSIEDFDTLAQQTPSGGKHYIFQRPSGADWMSPATSNTAAHGLDRRGDGGYIVVSPSVGANGKRYQWINPSTPVAIAPNWSGFSVSEVGSILSSMGYLQTPGADRSDFGDHNTLRDFTFAEAARVDNVEDLIKSALSNTNILTDIMKKRPHAFAGEIARMISSAAEKQKLAKLQPNQILPELVLSDLSMVQPEPSRWLSKGLILENGLHLVHAQYGGMKTTLMASLVLDLMMGIPVFGLPELVRINTERSIKKVLFINEEEDSGQFSWIVQRMHKARGVSVSANCWLQHWNGHPDRPPITLASLDSVLGEMSDPPEVIVLDYLSAFLPKSWDGERSVAWDLDNATVRSVCRELLKISRKYSMAIFMLHHRNKGMEEYRGASQWANSSDVVIRLDPAKANSITAKPGEVYTNLRVEKAKGGARALDMLVTTAFSGDEIFVSAKVGRAIKEREDTVQKKEKVAEVVEFLCKTLGEFRMKDLRECLDRTHPDNSINDKTIRRCLAEMKEINLLVKRDSRTWSKPLQPAEPVEQDETEIKGMFDE